MRDKGKNFISAVIYVHNAEKRIDSFLKMIIKVLEENFEHSEIICVNDNSTDDSLGVIKKAGRLSETASISIVNMSYFHGLEAAMNAGVDLAIGDFVFEFDKTMIDFGKEEIMQVYYRTLEGYDIVSAVPNQKERFGSKLFYKIFNRFTGNLYQMRTESFRILSRRVINRISSMNRTVPYRKAAYAGSGLKTGMVVYEPDRKTIQRQDKKEKGYRFGLAVDSLLLFTELGYRFSVMMTVLMVIISAFMIVYSLVIFVTANPVAGWTTTILFLSVAFFGLFGILTVVIKYLQLIINLLLKRKHYSFSEIEKLTK